jgi:glucose-6-phosphate dehydrogenase assembly protein OpcA
VTAVDAPLRLSHASGLHAVNRALAEMHRDMLRISGVDGGSVRLSVLNIVAACVDVESADLASQAVGRLGARHPARAVIVLANAQAAPQIEADVSLQCSAVDSGQVCAEQVRLTVSGEAAYHLASVVTPLLVPDIPVYLWLIGSPPLEQAFGQDAVAICERLIIDSGEYADSATTLSTLSHELAAVGDAISFCDIAWERITTWRQLIAQCFDGPQMRGLQQGVRRVDIECSGAPVSAQAWLLAGWLASRLDWSDGPGAPAVVTTTSDVDEAAGRDLLRVAVHCALDGHQALVIVERRGSALHTVIDVDGGVTAEGAVPVADIDTADLVGDLLETTGEDAVYRPALHRAALLANRSG